MQEMSIQALPKSGKPKYTAVPPGTIWLAYVFIIVLVLDFIKTDVMPEIIDRQDMTDHTIPNAVPRLALSFPKKSKIKNMRD